MHLFAVGEYDETLIVAERVVSVQARLAVDRAGQAMAPPAYERPTFEGSMIGLDNGTTIPVPQKPNEVGHRMSEAITRRTVMPTS